MSREQKVEIVTGLKSYEAVVIEIDLTQQLLDQCNEINRLLEEQLKTKDEIISNLKTQIRTYEKEIDLQDTQIRKQKRKNLATMGVGAGLIVLSLIL